MRIVCANVLLRGACSFGRVDLYRNDFIREAPMLSGGVRKAALEHKYGVSRVSEDPEPLVNYLDVSTVLA